MTRTKSIIRTRTKIVLKNEVKDIKMMKKYIQEEVDLIM